MATCPRCGGTFTAPPALSRTDNSTRVCPDCGLIEAVEAATDGITGQEHWEARP